MGAVDRVFRGRRGSSQQRPAAAVVAGMWRNGEQGAWYDPSDLSTMFQDATGTTPVYMPGQGQPDCWIGLQLDKRFGLARGPELLKNGDFSAGASNWGNSGADATHVVTFAGGTCRYQSDTTSPVMLVSQGGLSIVAGRWYEVTVVVSGWVSGSIKTDSFNGNSASGLVLAGGLGTFKVVGLAVSTTAVFSFLRNSANVDITIDSISVRELLGNHRWQGTATSRPTLSARYNLLVRTEDFSAAAWANLAGGTGGVPVKTPSYALAPNGTMTATRVQLALNSGSAIGDISGISQGGVPVAIGANYSGKVWLKASSPADVGKIVLLRHTGGTTYYPCALTADWSFFGRDETAGASTAAFFIGLRGASGGASDSVDMLVWGADLRSATDGVGLPAYQRVVDASNYDTVGFPLYRKPDGADDWMQTAAVDFSGTDKITAAIALRKINDASRAIPIELGTVAESSAGNFSIEAPSAGLQNLAARASGASSLNTVQTVAALAPFSAVLIAKLDAAAGVALRVNGGAWNENKVPFGGAFSNAPLYFDRRSGSMYPSSARDYGTIIVGRLLTAPESAALEKYLRGKSKAY